MSFSGVVSNEGLPNLLVVGGFKADACESTVGLVGADGVEIGVVWDGFFRCVCEVDECAFDSC